MSMSAESERELPLLPEHIIARNRAVIAIHDIKNNLSIGQHERAFEPIFSHLGGILAHADYVAPSEESNISTFYLENRDTSLDIITVDWQAESGHFIKWYHVAESEYSEWKGHQMILSERENKTYEVIIGEIITDSIYRQPGEDLIVKRAYNVWGFSEDGKIERDFEENLDISEVPLAVFTPPSIDTTVQ